MLPSSVMRLSSDPLAGHDHNEDWVRAVLERYRSILNRAVGTAVITIDGAGAVTGWNEGARQIFGWTEEEMLGSSLERVFPQDEGGASILRQEIAQASAQGAGGAEGWRCKKDGTRFWAIGEIRPL